MRFLGIDYGSKRMGLAISDPEGRMAFPYETCPAEKFKERKFQYLKTLCRKEKVEKIIVGLPISFSGKEERQAKEVRQFAQDLKKEINLPLEFENEILTTELAKRYLRDKSARQIKEKIDASSAAITLQSYLDKINR